MSVDTKEAGPREACCSKLKIFIASMCYLYFAKSFGDAYMKSSIIQIERRFGIPSSLIGVINGSFEMGNLLVIAFVSYFGGKLHRPRLIAGGCLVMAAGAFCSALPHFFMERYTFESSVTQNTHANASNIVPCTSNSDDELPSAGNKADCEKEAGSSMWVYVFVGNMLRGIGETPVVSLGVSYLDDFSKEENTAFYIACIQTIGMFGPIAGYMMGSFCAKIYVDIDTVDLDSITINHKDYRWVGAWWLGFLLTSILMLVAGIPFWFLPKSLPKQGQESPNVEPSTKEPEQEDFLPDDQPTHKDKDKPVTFADLAKDFLPSLKRLFSNGVYRLVLLVSLVALNSFIGLLTYEPKFMEQVYGQPSSKTIMLIGTMTLPAMAAGFITGGIVLKRFKLGMLGASRICVGATFLASCLYLVQLFLYCDNTQVAGLTVTYQGEPHVSHQPETMVSQCNARCSCSVSQWDPVCSYNGLTYASPCLAGCQTITGAGKDTMYGNCTCVREMMSPGVNMSAVLGQCPRKSDCDHMFKFYMALAVLASFINACGATPAYIILLRCIQPDLKSLALGMQTLVVRTLGGIPPPIYFGALIDLTCLKWGTKPCGGRGACRFYDANAFRFTFLGLIYGIFSATWAIWALLNLKILKRQKKLALRNQATENAVEATEMSKAPANIINNKEDMERHSTI